MTTSTPAPANQTDNSDTVGTLSVETIVSGTISADRLRSGAILYREPEPVTGSRAGRLIKVSVAVLFACYVSLLAGIATVLADATHLSRPALIATLTLYLTTVVLDTTAERIARRDGHLIRVRRTEGPAAAIGRVLPLSALTLTVIGWLIGAPFLGWIALAALGLYVLLFLVGSLMILTGRSGNVWDVVEAPAGTSRHLIYV